MKDIFTQVLQISLTGSIIALAVMALRFVLRKTPKRLICLLWALVVLRILCPFSIESRLSLIPNSIADGQVVSGLTAYREPELSVQSVPDGYAESIPVDGEFIFHEYQTPSTVPANDDLMSILTWVWVTGACVMILYAVISYLHLRHRMAEATRYGTNIWQSEYTDSPFVLGLLRPQIYLPYYIQSKDLPHVIAHEQAHIRRGDHWWKPLGYLILALHWFNPVLWLSYILLCRDIESACDEAVIATMDKPARQAYSTALLHCSIRKNHIAACPLAFGEVGVKERVTSVMNYKKPGIWIILTALVACLIVAVCFLTDPNPSREFPMTGSNVSNLDPEAIVERILDIEDWESSNVYVNSNNFSLQVNSDFNWVDSQAVRYFFSNTKTTYESQLRIFPDEGKYFLTEPCEWVEQQSIFLLRHYLDAIKYLPQDAIRKMAPADQYIIQHREEGTPNDYERVITYTSDGVKEIEGWYIHLQIQPLHADGEGFSGTGEEVIELFYGGGSNATVTQRFDLEPLLKADIQINLRNLRNGADTVITDPDALREIISFISQVEGTNPISSKGYYGGSYEVQIIFDKKPIFSIGFGDDETFNYGEYEDSSPARYELRCISRADIIRFLSRYDSSDFDWGITASDIQENPSFEGSLNLGLNAEIIEIDYDQKILYVRDLDPSAEVFGDRCAIDCSYAISRYNLMYVNYDDPNDVRTIDFSELELGDAVIIGMYDSEKLSAFNGSAIAEQIQLGTQRIPSKAGEVAQAFDDEALIKKISKKLNLPADSTITFAGEYTLEKDALLWFIVDRSYSERYIAVRCEKDNSGKYQLDEILSTMTYAEDIVHALMDGEDIFLINNQNVRSILYQDEEGNIVKQIELKENDCPYVFLLAQPLNPCICSFVDSNGQEIR